MKDKGRLREGADADITVFDPETVREQATYKQPALRSAGVRFVIVNGKIVLEHGQVISDQAPGRWLRHSCDSGH
jgi:N-acyl-D-aspartate/D-glutamate deacylase